MHGVCCIGSQRHVQAAGVNQQTSVTIMATNQSQATSRNPVANLRQYGQSVWLDFLRRRLIDTGELGRLIAEDGLTGVTSNPAIFQKAIEGNDDYAAPIAEIAKDRALSPRQVFEKLAGVTVGKGS